MIFKRLVIIALSPFALILYYRLVESMVMNVFTGLERGDVIFTTLMFIFFTIMGAAFYGMLEEDNKS